MGWMIALGLLLISVSALLSDLTLHDTASTSARVRAILRRGDQEPSMSQHVSLAGSTAGPGAEKPDPGGARAGDQVEPGSLVAGHPQLPAARHLRPTRPWLPAARTAGRPR